MDSFVFYFRKQSHARWNRDKKRYGKYFLRWEKITQPRLKAHFKLMYIKTVNIENETVTAQPSDLNLLAY
jgi:hypothetical protein